MEVAGVSKVRLGVRWRARSRLSISRKFEHKWLRLVLDTKEVVQGF